MKKVLPMITLLFIFIIFIVLCVPLFISEDSVLKYLNGGMNSSTFKYLVGYPVSCLYGIILASRCSLLIQRDTKVNVAKVGLIYTGFFFFIKLIGALGLINDPKGLIAAILTIFMIYLIILTFIFEITASKKIVNIYQYIVAGITTLSVVLYIILVIKSGLSINISISNLSQDTLNIVILFLISILLTVSIPLVNFIFEDEIKESNPIDMINQNNNITKENIVNNSPSYNNQPQVVTPVQSTIKDMSTSNEVNAIYNPLSQSQEKHSLPIINTPVTINNQNNNSEIKDISEINNNQNIIDINNNQNIN